MKKEEKKELIKLELTVKEVNELANIFNIAVKAVGLEDQHTARNVLYFMDKIKDSE
jgi:hypothetical protein